MATSTSSHSFVKTDSTRPPASTRSAGASPRATAIQRASITVKLKSMTSARPPIAVLAALPQEIEVLAAQLTPSRRPAPRLTIWEGELAGEPMVLVLTGIGKVAGALATQFACDRFEPRSILNIGLAGGIESGVQPGRVIIVSGAVQHDYDARPVGPRGVSCRTCRCPPFQPILASTPRS